jgi:hypothetical protein
VLRAAGALALMLGIAACDQWISSPAYYHSVSVSAKTRGGAPVAGVELELYTGARPMGFGTTDGSGSFVFATVPDGNYGIYAYTFPAGYHTLDALTGGPRSIIKDGLTVSPTSSPHVDLVLAKEGPGTVKAVVLQPDGTPMAAVPITLVNQNTGTIQTELADASGTKVFTNVPYGFYVVRVTSPDWFPGSSAQQFVYTRGIPIDSGARDSVSLVISPCRGTLTARVINSSGAPVANYPLRLYTSTDILEEPLTDATGSHVFSGLVCGEYGIAIRPKAGYSYVDAYGLAYNSVDITRGLSVTFTYRVTP